MTNEGNQEDKTTPKTIIMEELTISSWRADLNFLKASHKPDK